MNKEKQIHELSESIYMSGHGLDWKDSDDIAEQLHAEGYRKRGEVIDEFAKRLKDYPINVRLPLLGLETKEEVEEYVNNLFDQIESIVDKIAEEMKGGEQK